MNFEWRMRKMLAKKERRERALVTDADQQPLKINVEMQRTKYKDDPVRVLGQGSGQTNGRRKKRRWA